jgi:hypothetical protein
MSMGPGRIEHVIAEAFSANHASIYTVEMLATLAYPGANRIEKKHRVAILRAGENACRRPGSSWWRTGHIGTYIAGTPIVFYNECDIRSYSMARYFTKGFLPYDWRTINAWFDRECQFERDSGDAYNIYSWNVTDMDPGGKFHDQVLLNIAARDGVAPPPGALVRCEAREKEGRQTLAGLMAMASM